MDPFRLFMLSVCVIVSICGTCTACPAEKFCKEKYTTTLRLFHEGIIMCPYISDFLTCFANASDSCNVTDSLEYLGIRPTVEEHCQNGSSVSVAGFVAAPLWWVDVVNEIPATCGIVDTCVQMAISRSDFYSCSTMLSTLDCIENKTSALCLRSSYTAYTEEDVKIHNKLNKDCSHCVHGAPCPEVAKAVLLEHIAEPLPCSVMYNSLSSIQRHPHLENVSMIEDLDRHFKEFQLLFTALCGTETLCVNGRLLILITGLQIVWYLFGELHEH